MWNDFPFRKFDQVAMRGRGQLKFSEVSISHRGQVEPLALNTACQHEIEQGEVEPGKGPSSAGFF